MNLCQDHWTRLRAKIEDRGLMHLVPDGGELAAAMMADQIEREEPTVLNFDPLMTAWSGVGGNAMQAISQSGANPLYLLGSGPEDAIDFGPFPKGAETQARLERDGKPLTWPRCALCYLGLAHELMCDGSHRCSLSRVDGYAWMLDKAADDALAKARELGLLEETS